jgi:cobalt-zinc-cadmium efflux system membrane fusion protein
MFLGAVPTLLVLASLAALGLWGHHSGWSIPKFADLRRDAPPEKEDWCGAHNVPLSRCLACNPELGGANAADWCKEHGVPESKCTLCHPEILTKGGADDWCREHGVPESSCTLCHPDLAVIGAAPASDTGITVTAGPAPAKPEKDPSKCLSHVLRVQFASPEAVRKAGVKLDAVRERSFAVHVEALGEVEYDQTRLARLSSRAAGSVWRVYKEVGDPVAKGEVLALVDAADVGRAKADFLQALTTTDVREKLLPALVASVKEGEALTEIKARVFERIRGLALQHLQTKNEMEAAEAEMSEARLQALEARTRLQEGGAALREARIRLYNAQQALLNLGLAVRTEDLAGLDEDRLAERLRFLGLPEAVTKGLDGGVATANLIPVTAPFDGVVISRDVVAGEVVDAARTLYVVADVRRMWVMLDVQPEDAGRLATGQPAVFFPMSGLETAVRGKLEWIATAADEKTRTVRARATVANVDGALRAHSFGRARIAIREHPKAVAVLSEAIHWEGCCHVVFVRLTDDIFQTRKVKPGARDGTLTEVLVGLLPGEIVATTGSHVLKSEIMKAALGAGCCD